MAKAQKQVPSRDIRGGTGKRARKAAQKNPKAERFQRDGRGANQKPRSANTRGERKPSDLIEGRRAAQEALASGMPLKSALVQAQVGERDSALEQLVRQFEAEGVAVERVPRSRLDALSSHGAHQGIVVRAQPFAYAELADIIRAAGEGPALVVVLDHVTDQGNLGAIVRTAEVVGAAGVVIPKARAAGIGVGAYKTSAGAVMHLPIAQVSNLARALDELKQAGFWACGATEHSHDDIWSAPVEGRLALVMGSEGDGISELVLKKCDFTAKLPQRGRIESLNVAQATTAICYEWLRRTSTDAS